MFFPNYADWLSWKCLNCVCSYIQDKDRPLHLDSHLHSHWRWSPLHSSLQSRHYIQICNLPLPHPLLSREFAGPVEDKRLWVKVLLARGECLSKPGLLRRCCVVLCCCFFKQTPELSVKAGFPHPHASDSWYYYQACVSPLSPVFCLYWGLLKCSVKLGVGLTATQ